MGTHRVEVDVSGLGTVAVSSSTGVGGQNRRLAHQVPVPATTWAVAHSWGVVPTSVVPVDSAGHVLQLPDDITVNATSVIVTFGAPVSGTLLIGG